MSDKSGELRTQCPPDLLRCPMTGGAVREMGLAEIRELNERIAADSAWHRDGTPLRGDVVQAFRSLKGPYAYVVREGIVLMLPALAVVTCRDDLDSDVMRDEKQVVQDFYDALGWHTNADGDFVDAEKFEDLRSVAAQYVTRCHERVKRHLPSRGRFLLDVASGPVQYDEYLAYSEAFQARVCVDLSFTALLAARRKLGRGGIYLLGDITNLPLRDGSVDAAVSLHTIYHVPADEQAQAFREVHRAIAPGATAVVVYAFRKSWAMRLAELPSRLIAAPIKLLTKWFGKRQDAVGPPLYFHAHPLGWFLLTDWPFEHEIHSWRSIPVKLSQAYCHDWLGGRIGLRLLYWLEECIPGVLGRYGAYPLIVLRKRPGQSEQLPRAA